MNICLFCRPGIKGLNGIIAMDFIHTLRFFNQVIVEIWREIERENGTFFYI